MQHYAQRSSKSCMKYCPVYISTRRCNITPCANNYLIGCNITHNPWVQYHTKFRQLGSAIYFSKCQPVVAIFLHCHPCVQYLTKTRDRRWQCAPVILFMLSCPRGTDVFVLISCVRRVNDQFSGHASSEILVKTKS